MRRLLPALWLAACAVPDPAPTELEELTRFFLVEYDEGEDPLIAEGVQNLESWYGGAELNEEGAIYGALEDLTPEELGALGMDTGLDLSWLAGAFEVTPQTCTMHEVTEVFLYPDQDELFVDSYVSYHRDYAQDPDCFRDGSCDRVDWTIDIESTLLLGTPMVYELHSGVRRVVSEDGDEYLLSRTVMPEPAVVGSEGQGPGFFDQSYQIEVFLTPAGEDQVLHLYALWNSGGLEGIDPDAALWQSQYLEGVRDWNDDIDAACQSRDW